MSRLFGDSRRLAQARHAECVAGPARGESRRGSRSRGVRTSCGRGPSAPAEAALTGTSSARRAGGPCSAGRGRAELHRLLREVLAGLEGLWFGPGLPVSGRSEEKTAVPADAERPPLSAVVRLKPAKVPELPGRPAPCPVKLADPPRMVTSMASRAELAAGGHRVRAGTPSLPLLRQASES